MLEYSTVSQKYPPICLGAASQYLDDFMESNSRNCDVILAIIKCVIAVIVRTEVIVRTHARTYVRTYVRTYIPTLAGL